MTQFSNSFTAKGVAVNLLDGRELSRAQENMGNMMIEAQKLKYDTFKRNEEEFLKMQDVDPVATISNAATEYQAKLIDTFNKKWGNIAQRTGSNLSTEQKIEQMKDRRFIESEGARIQGMQKAWEMEDEMVKKNPLDYDEEEHRLKTAEFMSTGKFDHNSIPYKAESVQNALIKYRGRIGQTKSITEPMKGTPGFQLTTEVTGTREEVAPIIVDQVMRNPKVKKDMLVGWSSLPQTEKNKYLDINKDGVVSPKEKNNSNPIIECYIDQNYEAAILRNPGTPQRIASGGGRATFNWDLGIGAGHNKNAEYPVQPQVKLNTAYGVFDLPDMISLGVASQTTEQQQIPEIIEIKDGKEVITQINDAARFNIISYSPSKDVIFVKILDDGETVEQDEVIALPAARYDSLLKKKPFGIDRASLIKNQLSQPVKTKPTVTDLSGLFKK